LSRGAGNRQRDGGNRRLRITRIDVADALRAFALAGILQVNIQSFVWGVGDPLGLFVAPPGALDAGVYLLIGTFVSSKFLSIFAFLFGFGFALQWRTLRRRFALVDARAAYRRRLSFLLALGIAHGVLLYFGDILTAYGLLGFLLLSYADMRPRALIAATARWWVALAVLVVVSTAAFEWMRFAAPTGDPTGMPPDVLARLTVYTQAGFAQQIAVRVGDYLLALGVTALVGVPQLMGLFLLGAVAGRLGWLARPQRHERVWHAATYIGIAALPFAAAAAWLNFLYMRDTPGDPGYVGYALGNVGALAACLYVAVFVRGQQRPSIRRLIAWLAPAGRMPLTNYVAQSVVMGALLSGWGLGLGDDLNRVELAALALLIVAAQVVISRQWIARFGVGPLESLWRRVTYGSPGP
jgi:uncharacterized protein